jgi:hypothetical protein
MPSRLFTLLGAAALTLVSATAGATAPPLPGTRALGMAGALRGSATGDSALTLNPSGMSLLRAYIIEAMYAHDRIDPGQTNVGRLSIVDSTSGFNISGGIYYNYLSDEAAGFERSGHEGGGALSFPLGQYLFIGGGVKYFRLSQTGGTRVRGFTFDAGLTLRPLPSVSIGVAAQNLADLHTDRAPRTVGGGVTLGAARSLLLGVDAVVDFTTRRDTGGPDEKVWHFMGGAEYTFEQGFALRAGGGWRGNTKAGYFAVGASYIAQIGAIDLGFQQDASGRVKETFFSVSARLFLPAPE